LPGLFDRDGRSDLNSFGGFSDCSIHQAIRSTESHRFAGGRSDEILKLGDRTWPKVTRMQLGEFNHVFRFGYRLRTGTAVIPADGLTPHRKLSAGRSSAVVGGA
jgi:hypothetical protein